MRKVSKALITLMLASLMVAIINAPAFAMDSDIAACWNNCGIGGGGTKLD
ncbi:MAG TPA: hypothetical protein VD973_22180 [Symbiobacteriaceae bacterium]|jgi:Spy/CpxP family protein refolding chaperone|nr:hypothetical protein [Symbiobacteriaceae bacterium]